MVNSFKDYLELPDFSGAVVKSVTLGVGFGRSWSSWEEGLELKVEEPAKTCDILLEPIKWYSFRLHSMIPDEMRDREVKVAAGELVRTMVNFLKEVVLDRIAVVCFEKQFHDISLFIVAYEMKGFDLRHARFLKSVPGFVFGWLYGGLLTLDHLE